MESRPRTVPRCSAHGLLLAVLAVLCQALFAPVLAPRMALAQTAAFADVPLCHGEPAAELEGGQPAPQHRQELPCPLCPVCQAVAAVALLPMPTTAHVALPPNVAALPAPPPPARAPPTPTLHPATFPTGPPDLA